MALALRPGTHRPTSAGRGHRFTGVRDQLRSAPMLENHGIVKHAGLDSRVPTRQRRGMAKPVAPESCRSMSEVREGVDSVDAELVALLSRRFGYMRAAARIKPDRAAVRDEERKAEVIDHVRRLAREQAVPEQVAASLWDRLIEDSIAYELETWDALRERG